MYVCASDGEEASFSVAVAEEREAAVARTTGRMFDEEEAAPSKIPSQPQYPLSG